MIEAGNLSRSFGGRLAGDRVLMIVGGRLVADEPIGASFGSSGSRCARRWSASGAA